MHRRPAGFRVCNTDRLLFYLSTEHSCPHRWSGVEAEGDAARVINIARTPTLFAGSTGIDFSTYWPAPRKLIQAL